MAADTLNKRLQQQNLVNFLKLFHPSLAHLPVHVIGLLNYILYAMIHQKWELLADKPKYSRLHLKKFCINSGLSKENVCYYLRKLSTKNKDCEKPLLKIKSYYKSMFITFTGNMIDCLQIKTVSTHLRYAINNHNKYNKNVEYKAHPLFLEWKELFNIQKVEKKENKENVMKQALIEDKLISKNKDWQLNLIKEICKMAKENNTVLFDKKVFNHLDNNGELKKLKTVDKACGYLQEIYDGIFLRRSNLFGKIKESVLNAHNTKGAIEKLKSCRGDIDKISEFVKHRAYYYLLACESGMDCPQGLKNNWAVNIDEFFLKYFYKTDDHVAYFLLYKSKPVTTAFGEAMKICNNVNLSDYQKVRLDDFAAKRVYKYDEDDSSFKKFWENIKILVDEFDYLKEKYYTSYFKDSFIDYIFEEVEKINHDWIYPNTFKLSSMAMTKVMKIIKDK